MVSSHPTAARYMGKRQETVSSLGRFFFARQLIYVLQFLSPTCSNPRRNELKLSRYQGMVITTAVADSFDLTTTPVIRDSIILVNVTQT